MVRDLTPPTTAEAIDYPDSDGQPMADNTKQFRWIVTLKENLEILFADRPDVFVAGDLLWYPVEGDNRTRQAPDVMVVFGRPKGDRGSYRQWVEDGIAPQVVFEILSPGNRLGAMNRKLLFYERYGVEEYYLYDPDRLDLSGTIRQGDRLTVVDEMDGWTSPRLGIRFQLGPDGLEVYRPDGERFLTPVELSQMRDREREEKERALADLQAERDRYAALVERLRSRGIDPDALE